MLLKVALLSCALACAPAPQPPGPCAPVGDLSKPVALIAIAPDAQGTLHELHGGDALLLQKPPQGGYVAFAGVAATNLNACAVQITGELLDAATGSPITGLDQRQVHLTVPSGGYYWPANPYLQTANIPSCPDALQQGLVGRATILRLQVRDVSGRSAQLDVQVTPTCAAGDSRCACLCGPNPQGC